MNVEEVSAIAVDCGLQVHRDLGPGLLENAYEAVLSHLLAKRGLFIERQKIIPIQYEGLLIDQGFRADIIVEQQLLIELKAVERLAPVHARQVATYLKFLDLRVGLLMNFSCEKFTDGLKRLVNNHSNTQSSQLNLHR